MGVYRNDSQRVPDRKSERTSPCGSASAVRLFLIPCPHVNNNPVNRNDPSGHASKDADGPGCYDDNCRTAAEEEAYRVTYQWRLKENYPNSPDWLITGEDPWRTGIPALLGLFVKTGYLFREVFTGDPHAAQDLRHNLGGYLQTATFFLPGNNEIFNDKEFYSVAYEVNLPVGTYPGTTRAVHNHEANAILLNAMKDPEFAQGMNNLIPNIENQISGSKAWSSPDGWTWHHVPNQPGVLQLVPSTQHWGLWNIFHPNNVGGFKLWGK